ncbi:MAG: phosphoglycerate kinase [Candidatus Nealsonbacteria bacterium]|nr:phosphoglycerate kinase [Candidatus Nealsonbacteria bacterium]
MKTIRDFNVQHKRVLVRCDFNVPLSAEGSAGARRPACAGREILDDFRLRQTLPTLLYLMENKAKIILMSHLGRPEGKPKEAFRMDPIQARLMEFLNVSIAKAPDCIGPEIEKWTRAMMPGEILLLENLRFHKEEEDNDESFAKELAKLGDIYINDAFSASHRAHASIVGIPKFIPACAGFLLEKELKAMSAILDNPTRPLVTLIGGAKAETKLKLINKLSEVADFVLISGLLDKAVVSEGMRMKYPQKIVAPIDEARDGKDIGPRTVDIFKDKIAKAKTIFWNGPFGKIEDEEFVFGTKEIAEAIIDSRAYSVVGGGETIEFINQFGLSEKFGFLSTGGGAMLECREHSFPLTQYYKSLRNLSR